VLVQDTNHFSRRADALLARFDFIPHARVDDVMVSYAVPGGSVGPHVDSYDVFLLQGHGRRRWQISRQKDHSFVPGLDLKILERFVPEEGMGARSRRHALPPPGVAHHGVAETECLTWSIGFRAPTDRELVAGFLDFMRDRLDPDGQYRDPGEGPPSILRKFLRFSLDMWRAPSRRSAGRRPTCASSRAASCRSRRRTCSSRPRRARCRAASSASARRAAASRWIRVRACSSPARPSSSTARGARGPAGARAAMKRFADRRRLAAPVDAPESFWDTVHSWYVEGFVQLGRRQAMSDTPDAPPKPTYRPIFGAADSLAAIDEVIAAAQRTIRIFDFTLANRGFNSPARTERLRAFLVAGAPHRLLIALHDTDPLERECPRLLTLLRQFPMSIEIHRTLAQARNAMDPFVVADDHSVWHQLHYEQPRAIVAVHSPADAMPIAQRFDEIWELSEPAVSATTLGL
jgi:50S ribosomal protein L16 3-hydroxylase